MKRLLHVIATPRAEDSRTLEISRVFLENFRKKFPDCAVDELNVATERLPPLTVKALSGKYVLLGGGDLSGELKAAWSEIERHIERFLSADTYLISTPMWNFGIPYCLKEYIDVIVQPKYLFRYTDKGVEGLAKDKKMFVMTSRGGDYGPKSPMRGLDFEEPYLRAVFGFVGITEVTFIIAEPMDALGPEVRRDRIEKAKEAARKAVDSL
jgi:FMN-dependent NADH-azoreductase